MLDWLNQFIASFGLKWIDVLIGAGLFVATSIGGLLAVAFILVRLPADYFSESSVRNRPQRQTAYGWAIRVAKSVLGVVIVIVGIILSLPGIPGPGLLTIFVGIMMIDSPKKRRLERWFLMRPGILDSINEMRRKHNRSPLVLDDEPLSQNG